MHVVELEAGQMDTVESICEARGWERFAVDHARFAFRGPRVVVVGYPRKNKLTVSGQGTEEFVLHTLEAEVTGEARLGYDEVHHPDWFEPHAGMDESGKGDFWGPVISACVVADGAMVKAWLRAGVKDSKRLGDRQVAELDELIRRTPGVAVRTAHCGMERYNELMARPRANLNRLLAWLHAKSLEQALAERPVPWALLDQFSTEPLVQQYLKEPSYDLRMRPKAEADPVVAAASIVARAEYVRQVERLSAVVGEPLLKGAGSGVRAQALRLVKERGAKVLPALAKLHFRTAYEVVSEAGQLAELPLKAPAAKVDPSVFRRRAKGGGGAGG